MTALWGLLLALPLVAAYLVRARSRRRAVSSLAIYRVLQQQVEHRRRFAVPSGWLSLLLALGALLALVGSLLETAPPRDLVVLLDQSTSMRAGDRQVEATEHLEAVVRSLARRDRVALVDHRGRVRVPLTTDHERILAPLDVPEGDWSEGAFAVASALGEVLLVSDGGALVPEGTPHLLVGEAAPNLGITELSARRVDGLGGVEVQVRVLNATGEDAIVPLLVGEAVEGLWVPDGEQVTKTLRLTGDSLQVALPDGDGAAFDDRATVTLPPLAPARVLLLTDRPDSFLATALRVHPRVRLELAASADTGAGYDLVVLEGVPGPTDAPTVAFGVPAEHFGLEGRPVKRPELLRWAFEDPTMRFVDLDDVKVLRGEELLGGEPLLETGSGALAVRIGDDVVVGFALDDSDLALRLAFVNLVANLVDQAAPTAPAPAVEGVLSHAESRLLPVRLGPAPELRTGPSPWRLALLAAALLLVAEALLLRRRPRSATPEEQRRAA